MKKGHFLCGSMEYINKEALRILKLFGNDDITSVKATVALKKYFLIPKKIMTREKTLFMQ